MAFCLGVVVAQLHPPLGALASSAMGGLAEVYGRLAPAVIFVVLASSLGRILDAGSSGFALRAIGWLTLRRLLACLWAVGFTAVVFALPVASTPGRGFGAALGQATALLGEMALRNPFFFAIYAAIALAVAARRLARPRAWLGRIARGVESSGPYFLPVVPLFLFATGAYLQALPSSLRETTPALAGGGLFPLAVLGLRLPTDTTAGLILIYGAVGLLTGIGCLVWHLGLLGLVRWKVPGFSVRAYFRSYWLRVYPLLWATSSEALATPLNLYLVRRHYPQVRAEVRRFVVGIGSYLSINGTMICVFVLAGAVARLLGLEPSLLDLLLSIPVVFVIGFAVPGLPGELLLFAGPLVSLLGVPQETEPSFVALYLGLQLGLPDGFRTGNNSTDDCLFSILLNESYRGSVPRGS